MMWVYRLGLEHAKQFLLSGDAINAETAHRDNRSEETKLQLSGTSSRMLASNSRGL